MHLWSQYREQSHARAEEQQAGPPLGTSASQGTVLTPQPTPGPGPAVAPTAAPAAPFLGNPHTQEQAVSPSPAPSCRAGLRGPIPTRDKASFMQAQQKEEASAAATPFQGPLN